MHNALNYYKNNHKAAQVYENRPLQNPVIEEKNFLTLQKHDKSKQSALRHSSKVYLHNHLILMQGLISLSLRY